MRKGKLKKESRMGRDQEEEEADVPHCQVTRLIRNKRWGGRGGNPTNNPMREEGRWDEPQSV